jgi:hypothetical protein
LVIRNLIVNGAHSSGSVFFLHQRRIDKGEMKNSKSIATGGVNFL